MSADPFTAPRAAWGPFPYPGRTVADVDADAEARRQRLFAPARLGRWCDQCQALRADFRPCGSRFCSLRKSA